MVYLKGIFVVRSTFVVLVLTVLVQHAMASHARIAYKKPIAGSKTNRIRERRIKTTQAEVHEPAASMQVHSITERPITPPVDNDIRDELPSTEHTTITTTTNSHQRNAADDSVEHKENASGDIATTEASNEPAPCTCGIFLASQIKRGSGGQPEGKAIITNELDRHYTCNAVGQKQCQTKCLETIVQHLPNSANILCATLNRDCRKERAYLFIKNCRQQWINTNLAAGREYCCKNGQPYQCPMV